MIVQPGFYTTPNRTKRRFQAESLPVATGGDSYVFLQRFHLEGVMGFAYHTEILACEKSGFSAEGQQCLHPP